MLNKTRLKFWASVIVINLDVADIIREQGCTGLWFPEAEGCDGIG